MAAFWTALVLVAISAVSITEAYLNRGVCLGTNGDNLPSASDMVSLYKSNNISRIRLFEPNPKVLEALRSSKINVSLGVRNEDIQNLASSPNAAETWFTTHVKPYLTDVVFQYIVVGNDVIPRDYTPYVAPAMQNFQTIIDKVKLANIKVTTVMSTNALATFSPPSSGAFLDNKNVTDAVFSILQFLSKYQTPLMINVYPYFAYAADPVKITLDYALFNANTSVVQDGNLSYQNLFDALVDAFYSAMEKQGVDDVGIMISETGWPSNGNGNITTPELAATYNKNFVVHILYFGTPKRPVDLMQWFVAKCSKRTLKLLLWSSISDFTIQIWNLLILIYFLVVSS